MGLGVALSLGLLGLALTERSEPDMESMLAVRQSVKACC